MSENNLSLNKICYEKIKDNYYWGLFGDFKLIIDKKTGFFNATKLCKSGGKKYKKWFENKDSKELIEYLEKNSLGPKSDQQNIYIITPTGNELDKLISGTYVCDDLILNIATWVSHEFYIKCVKIIKNYFINEYEIKFKDNEVDRTLKLNEIDNFIIEKNKIIEEDKKLIKKLTSSFNQLDTRIQHVKQDIITRPPYDELNDILVLFNLNNGLNKYYILRVQIANFNKRLNQLQNKFSNIIEIRRWNNVPNAIHLFNRTKHELKRNGVLINKNIVTLMHNFTQEHLINTIQRLYIEKNI